MIGIIFKDNQKKILILKRRDVPLWVLPGGGIDENETPETAMTREIKEETGLDVAISRKIAEYSPINALTALTHVFECKTSNPDSLSTGEETEDISFYPVDDLPTNFFPLHLIWLHEALDKQYHHLILKKPITQVTYWRVFSYFCQHPLLTLRFIFSLMGLPINSKK